MLLQRKIAIASLSGLLLGTSIWALFIRADPSEQPRPYVAERKQGVISLPETGEGEIVSYSQDALEHSITKHNVLFFYAGWCVICTSVERSLEAAAIPNTLTIFKIDYDSSEGQALAKKYNIPTQHVMVQVDTNGNQITQWESNYNDSIAEISEQLQ